MDMRYAQPGTNPTSNTPRKKRQAIKPPLECTKPWHMHATPQRKASVAIHVGGESLRKKTLLGISRRMYGMKKTYKAMLNMLPMR
jgi:hypothetical protein